MTQQSPVSLDSCWRKIQPAKSHDYPASFPGKNPGKEVCDYCDVKRKVPFSKCFPSTVKRKAGSIKFLQFEERFHVGLVWTSGLNGEMKM